MLHDPSFVFVFYVCLVRKEHSRFVEIDIFHVGFVEQNLEVVHPKCLSQLHCTPKVQCRYLFQCMLFSKVLFSTVLPPFFDAAVLEVHLRSLVAKYMQPLGRAFLYNAHPRLC